MVNHELHYKNTSFMPRHSVGRNEISFITLANVFKVFSNKPSFCQICLDAVVARNLLESLYLTLSGTEGIRVSQLIGQISLSRT